MPAPTDTRTQLPLLGLGSEERIRALADLLPDGLFTTDLEGRITFWNRAAEELTGWARDQALGQGCSLLAGDLVNGCSCGAGPLRCDLARTGRSSKQCSIRTRDGRVLVIVKNAVPLLDPAGAPLGALETFTAVGTAEALAADACATTSSSGRFVGLVGDHPVMRDLFRMIDLVARAASPVLVVGESGAGKDAVALAIHRASARAAGPFVRAACAGLDDEALARALGEAEGGTLVLDGLGDLPAAVQARLLRVVEDGTVERAGRAVRTDVRLLSTALDDLRPAIAAGRLRADLYFRVAAFPLRVPSLREHASDVAALAARVLARLPARPHLSEDALRALEAYAWPGNVRELESVVELAALRAGAGEIRREHLPPGLRLVAEPAPPPADPGAERARIEAALARAGGNRTRAAEALGMSRVTLWKHLKRLGITVALAVTGSAGHLLAEL